MKYFVIALVDNKGYLTKVEAQSLLSAEHLVLEEGVYTRIGCGVEAACAYGIKEMKTDAFIGAALGSEPISYPELVEIIHRHNKRLKEKIAAQDRIIEIEKQMKALAEELEVAKQSIAK